VRFPAAAGETFHVVVDTDGSQPSTSFDAHVECGAGTSEAVCDDGFDDDADYLIDCDDAECSGDLACSYQDCSSTSYIACGDSNVPGSTSGFGATNALDNYTCWSDVIPNSPEQTYVYVPLESGWVNFAVSDFAQYPMLFVLEDDGDGCSTKGCIAHNYYSVEFFAEAGKSYYLVVDGFGGQPYSFNATLICDPPENESVCNDGVDEDADGAPDCYDSACGEDPLCAAAVCAPAYALDCSSVNVTGSTSRVGATDLVSSYACSPGTDTSGAEFVYQLGPLPQGGPVTITTREYDAYPIVAVMEDNGTGCNPGSCVAEQYYSVSFDAEAGKTYYVAVEGDGVPSMSYELSVLCNPPASESGLCADGIDNDGDLASDCQDGDCSASCADPCTPLYHLDAGATLSFGDTSGGSNLHDGYGCYPDIALPGNEFIYTFVPPSAGRYLFTLSNETDYGAIAVLFNDGSGCNTTSCLAFQYYSVAADLEPNQVYYVAVDAPNAGNMTYDLSVIYNPPAAESGLCADGIDNDGDFDIDCYDPDCGCTP